MLRTIADQPTLWDSVLPEELLRLPAELARVDALLDDPATRCGASAVAELNETLLAKATAAKPPQRHRRSPDLVRARAG